MCSQYLLQFQTIYTIFEEKKWYWLSYAQIKGPMRVKQKENNNIALEYRQNSRLDSFLSIIWVWVLSFRGIDSACVYVMCLTDCYGFLSTSQFNFKSVKIWLKQTHTTTQTNKHNIESYKIQRNKVAHRWSGDDEYTGIRYHFLCYEHKQTWLSWHSIRSYQHFRPPSHH